MTGNDYFIEYIRQDLSLDAYISDVDHKDDNKILLYREEEQAVFQAIEGQNIKILKALRRIPQTSKAVIDLCIKIEERDGNFLRSTLDVNKAYSNLVDPSATTEKATRPKKV